MKRLETERLRLDPVTCDNAETLWKVMQSAHLRDYQDVPYYTLAELRDRILSRPRNFDGRTNGRFEWLLHLRASGAAIGWISLRVGEGGPGIAELGYTLLTEGRGQGFATEGVRAVIAEAFTVTNLAVIEAACVVANLPSRSVLERLAFEEMRIQRNGAVVRGRAVDIFVFRMSRRRWERILTGEIESPA